MAEKLIVTLGENLKKSADDLNNAYKSGDLKQVVQGKAEVKKCIAEYNKRAHDDKLLAMAQAENPMREAVTDYTYGTKKDRITKNKDGEETGVEIVDSTGSVTMLEVAKEAKLPHTWEYEIEKVSELLLIRKAKENYDKVDDRQKVEIDRIRRRYKMSSDGRALEDGPNPTSNTQLIKRLQKVLDEIVPNGGKIMTRHLNSLLERFGGDDKKETNGLKFAGTRATMGYVQKLYYSVVTGTEVKFSYKEEKEDAVVAKADEPKTEEPKAEGSTEAAA